MSEAKFSSAASRRIYPRPKDELFKAAHAEERAAHWLAEANQWAERGNKILAEKLYSKSQLWHDRMNKLRGQL